MLFCFFDTFVAVYASLGRGRIAGCVRRLIEKRGMRQSVACNGFKAEEPTFSFRSWITSQVCYSPLKSLKEPVLNVVDLHVEIAGKEVLKGVNLCVYPGETHVLFGPNGSGKSTLIKTIIGLRFRVLCAPLITVVSAK